MIGVELEIDPQQLKGLERRLSPELYDVALGNLQSDATLLGDRVAKENTPVVTGNARRNTIADTSRFQVEARYPYFRWLDTGERESGARMRTRVGGYQIRATVRRDVEAALPKLIDKAAAEVAQQWAG